jgi:hypothetical protein
MADKETIKQLIEHDFDIRDALERLTAIEEDVQDIKNKRIIREWLYTKCIWVWTIFLGWLLAIGAYIGDHYEKVYIVIVAAIKALHQMDKQ